MRIPWLTLVRRLYEDITAYSSERHHHPWPLCPGLCRGRDRQGENPTQDTLGDAASRGENAYFCVFRESSACVSFQLPSFPREPNSRKIRLQWRAD